MSEVGFIGSSILTYVKRNTQELANTPIVILCVYMGAFELNPSSNLHCLLHHYIVQDIFFVCIYACM